MGHLQVQEGDRKQERGGVRNKKVDTKSVKRGGEGVAWEERQEKRNEFQRE